MAEIPEKRWQVERQVNRTVTAGVNVAGAGNGNERNGNLAERVPETKSVAAVSTVALSEAILQNRRQAGIIYNARPDGE